MRIAPIVVVAVVGCGAAVLAQSKMGTPGDEAAILENRDAQNAAYNRHDAKAYAMLMAEEVDRIDASGTAILDIDAVVTRSSGPARNHATFVYAKRNGVWTAVAQRVFQAP